MTGLKQSVTNSTIERITRERQVQQRKFTYNYSVIGLSGPALSAHDLSLASLSLFSLSFFLVSLLLFKQQTRSRHAMNSAQGPWPSRHGRMYLRTNSAAPRETKYNHLSWSCRYAAQQYLFAVAQEKIAASFSSAKAAQLSRYPVLLRMTKTMRASTTRQANTNEAIETQLLHIHL